MLKKILLLALNISLPYFNGRTSFLTYPTLTNSYSISFISLEIRPASPDGLILLNTQLNGPDFIAIVLHQGKVEFWYDLGQGAANISSTTSLTLNEWHTIQVMRNWIDGELQVDSEAPVMGHSPGYFIFLQISSELYLGAASTPANLPAPLRGLGGYQGCIRELYTSQFGTAVDLVADATYGRGLTQCHNLDVCENSTCLNGGMCMNTLDSFLCVCLPSFSGRNCATINCGINSPCLNNGVYQEDLVAESSVMRCKCNCSAPFTGQNCSESKHRYTSPIQ